MSESGKQTDVLTTVFLGTNMSSPASCKLINYELYKLLANFKYTIHVEKVSAG